MATQRSPFPAKIDKLLLFNNSWPQKEGEEINKLIYYFSARSTKEEEPGWEFNDSDENGLLNCDKEELRDAVNAMGLCEALINFVKNFGRDEEVYSVHGSRVRLSMREVEENFWLGISLILPRTPLHESTGKTKGECHYHDGDLNDHLVHIVLKEIYETFYLFHGRFQAIWEKSDQSLPSLRDVCSRFFHWFLPSLQLSTINLGELFDAMQNLTLDEATTQVTHDFVGQVLSCDERCKHVLFLFNAQMILSTLDLNNARIIYRYLVSTIIPEVASEEISESIRSKVSRRTRFIRRGLKMFLDGENSHYIMNVYRSINGATLVILLDSTAGDHIDEVLNKLDLVMFERVPELAKKLSEIYVQELTLDNNLPMNSVKYEQVQGELFRYAYYNTSDASFKSNAGFNGILDQRKNSDYEFSKPVLDLESDLRHHICTRDQKDPVEIIAKTTNESWLVVSQSGAKTLFSSLNHKNDNLVDAADAVSQHISKRFTNFFDSR